MRLELLKLILELEDPVLPARIRACGGKYATSGRPRITTNIPGPQCQLKLRGCGTMDICVPICRLENFFSFLSLCIYIFTMGISLARAVIYLDMTR